MAHSYKVTTYKCFVMVWHLYTARYAESDESELLIFLRTKGSLIC